MIDDRFNWFAWFDAIGERTDLRPAERHVALVISRRANGTAECWPSRRHIMQRTGYGARAVSMAIAGLERRGILEVHRSRGHGSVYLCRDPEGWLPGEPDRI